MPTILHVVGARPNFMKVAPIVAALRNYPALTQRLIHTGQHYDRRMAQVFFDDLGLPAPDRDLEVGSGTQVGQTATVMLRFEAVITEEEPALVVVIGDVNSTLAAALAAAKMGRPVAHVEAGLRSHDLTMPEEINRLVIDRLSSILLAPTEEAAGNLRREGLPEPAISVVGNVMIDTLLRHRRDAPWDEVRDRLALAPRGYAVLTLHRQASVDHPDRLRLLLERIAGVAARLPVVWPVHPRAARRLTEYGIDVRVPGLRLIDPLGYRECVALLDHARCVLTDSGGIQVETTVLGVPCFTLRDNTEWPDTVEAGTNTLVMADGRLLPQALDVLHRDGGKRGRAIATWDGRSGERVAAVLAEAVRAA